MHERESYFDAVVEFVVIRLVYFVGAFMGLVTGAFFVLSFITRLWFIGQRSTETPIKLFGKESFWLVIIALSLVISLLGPPALSPFPPQQMGPPTGVEAIRLV